MSSAQSPAQVHSQIVEKSALISFLSRLPGATYLLVLLSVILTIAAPEFFSIANLTNVALQVAVLCIVSFGMTMVILTEGIDLSLGPVLGLCGVVMALMVVSGYPLIAALR
jgi:ribose transport system permease protein